MMPTTSREESSGVPDDRLIENVQRGESACFSVLFERYVHRVFGFVTLFVKNREDARDVTQEIFTKVFQGLKGYRPEGSFQRWLFTIARRHLIDRGRRKTIGEASIDTVPDKFLADPVHHGGIPSGGNFEECLRGILPRERELLRLRFVEGFSYKEIADLTDLSEGTLRNLVSKLLKQLREEYKSHEL